VSDQKTPLDQALDLFVYAPLGLALSVRELLPQLAEKGRKQVTGQVTTAKVVGEFAVNKAQRVAERRLRQAQKQAEEALTTMRPPARPSRPRPAVEPRVDARPSAPTPLPETVTPPVTAPAPTVEGEAASTVASPLAAELAAEPVPTPAVDSLAIPGYDTLSASQVVQRLPGLAGVELEAIRAYESAGRARKTILNRVAQLQGTNGAG